MLLAGTARRKINPPPGVELTGWGYYIDRRWERVHDDLQATAIAVEGPNGVAIIVALDLMVIDERFTKATRDAITAETGVPPSSILLTCSHSHNAPAAGGLLGVGECDRAALWGLITLVAGSGIRCPSRGSFIGTGSSTVAAAVVTPVRSGAGSRAPDGCAPDPSPS